MDVLEKNIPKDGAENRALVNHVGNSEVRGTGAVDEDCGLAWGKVIAEEVDPLVVESGLLQFGDQGGGVHTVKGTLDVGEKNCRLVTVVCVKDPSGHEECCQVVARCRCGGWSARGG